MAEPAGPLKGGLMVLGWILLDLWGLLVAGLLVTDLFGKEARRWQPAERGPFYELHISQGCLSRQKSFARGVALTIRLPVCRKVRL